MGTQINFIDDISKPLIFSFIFRKVHGIRELKSNIVVQAHFLGCLLLIINL